jgi:hypothetical protein
MVPEVEEPLDGSPLCLECGLCCHGALHHYAVLREDEVEAANQLGLKVERQRDYLGFVLPCSKIDGNRCTIYEQRLSTCSSYRCGLLERYRDRRISLEDALPLVAEARRLFAAAQAMLPSGTSFRTARWRWRRRSRGEPGGEIDSAERPILEQSFLRIALLDRFLDRHFRLGYEHAFMGEGDTADDDSDTPVPRDVA